MKATSISFVTLGLAALLAACGAQTSDKYDGSDQTNAMSAPPVPPAGGRSQGYDAAANNAMAEEMAMDIATDSIASMMSSSAAMAGSPTKDTSDEFIITAAARFRVQEVRNATFAVEKITAQHGGYVAHTHLQSTVNRTTNTPVSDDSSLVTTFYTVSNDLVLRIPAAELDSTLRALGKMALYLDYRSIDRTNAKLMILRERLEARRANRSIGRLEDAVDDGQAKLRDRAAVEQAIYDRETAADESFLRTMELKDQIALTTVSISIYQREAWTQELVAREKPVDAYGPGFWERAGEAIADGWDGLLSLVVGLLHAWPLLLLIAIVVGVIVFVARRSGRKA